MGQPRARETGSRRSSDRESQTGMDGQLGRPERVAASEVEDSTRMSVLPLASPVIASGQTGRALSHPRAAYSLTKEWQRHRDLDRIIEDMQLGRVVYLVDSSCFLGRPCYLTSLVSGSLLFLHCSRLSTART